MCEGRARHVSWEVWSCRVLPGCASLRSVSAFLGAPSVLTTWARLGLWSQHRGGPVAGPGSQPSPPHRLAMQYVYLAVRKCQLLIL